MLTNLDALTSHALALPPEDRIALAERLWESVEDSVDDDQAELFAEIDRRIADLESGAATAIPFDEAMRQIRDSLR